MKRILLSNGGEALVDDADYEKVIPYIWWQSGRYAVRALPREGRKNSPLELMHVFLLGKEAGTEIDHHNGEGLDNRRNNLRRATHSRNCANRGKPRGYYASPFKGVSWSRNAGKWRAYIKQDYLQRHLGYFVCELEAARAHDAAAKTLYGEFAKTNLSHRH